MMTTPLRHFFPYKSSAGALLFCIFFGPVGLLYASLIGGIILIALSILVLAYQFFLLLIPLWLMACIGGVITVERYNKKIYNLNNS